MNSDMTTLVINFNFGDELTLDEINGLTGVYTYGNVSNERFGPELTWIEVLDLIQTPTKNYKDWWTNVRLRQIKRDVETERFWTLIDGKVFTIRYRNDGRFFVKNATNGYPCALLFHDIFLTLPENEIEDEDGSTDSTKSNDNG